MKKNIVSELLRIVRAISGEKKMSDRALLPLEYLDKGLIDSFQFVEMITKLEENFGIKFSAAELTSERFRTLKGVAEIIKENIKVNT